MNALQFHFAGFGESLGDSDLDAGILRGLDRDFSGEGDSRCLGSCSAQFQGVGARTGFETDAGDPVPGFPGGVIAEPDLMSQPFGGEPCQTRRRRDIKRNRGSVHQQWRLPAHRPGLCHTGLCPLRSALAPRLGDAEKGQRGDDHGKQQAAAIVG